MKPLLMLVVICSVFFATSCKEQCEKENTGTIILNNTRSFSISVAMDGAYLTTISSGGRYKDEVEAGEHIFTLSGNGTQGSVSVNVAQCKDNKANL